MNGAIICPNPNVIIGDPRFAEVRDAYQGKYDDNFLANALMRCRERYEKDDDWFPISGSDKARLTYFINNIMLRPENSPKENGETADSLQNIYSTLYQLYTPEQLDDRLSLLFQNFSEEVDKLEDADTTGRTRQQLIEAQASGKNNGFKVIMDRIFKTYETEYTFEALMQNWEKDHPAATEEERAAAEDDMHYIADEIALMLENKARLAALAAPRIGEVEGFRVDIRDFEIFLVDEEEDDSENTDTENDEDKTEGSKGDRYGDFRTVKLMSQVSPRVRRFLRRIPRRDAAGEIIYGDLGTPKFLDVRQAIIGLQKTLVNSDCDSMMEDLRAATDTYPWMEEIVRILDKDTDLQTGIWVASKRAETVFMYTDTENGRLSVHVGNTRSRGNALMQEAGNNLRGGFTQDDRFCIYTGYGALKSKEELGRIKEEYAKVAERVKMLAGVIRMVDGESSFKEKIIDAEIQKANEAFGGDHSYLKLPPAQAMKALLDYHPELVTDTVSLLRGIGFSISEKQFRDLAMQGISKKSFKYLHWNTNYGHNRLFQVVDKIASVYKWADYSWKKGIPTGQYLYNTASDIYREINSLIALAQYNEIEPRVTVEDKSMSSYNHVNPLHQVFDALSNKAGKSEEAYQKDLQNDFLQYEGYAIGTGDRRQVYGWLKIMRDSMLPEMQSSGRSREDFRVIDGTTIFHKEYAHMSRQQKLINGVVMFFQGASALRAGQALYEVPIQGDYSSAYNFISAPRYSKEEVIDNLADEVLLEIDRISAIERRSCKQIYAEDGTLVDNPDYDPNRAVLSVYEKQGMKFQIFPEFNDMKLRASIRGLSAEATRKFVRDAVVEQMKKVVARDFKTVENSKMLTNTYMKSILTGIGDNETISMYVENGKVDGLSDEAKSQLESYFMNVYYARQQITKLVVGGTEQFDGLIDYEKRNMFSHATHTSLYTKATWKGKPVGKKTQTAAYVEDDVVKSAMYDNIAESLKQLYDEKYITKEQYDTMIDAYKHIKDTDGAALRTLESHRIIMIESDQWTDRMEDAYNRIVAGHPTKGDIDLFIAHLVKPVYNGYEHIEAAAGPDQKPVRLTTLHKYAEMTLLPASLAKYCLQTKAIPMQAFEMAQKELGDVDIFLFHSCVKVGYHSGIRPFAKWGDIKKDDGSFDEEEAKRLGWEGEGMDERIIGDSASMANYIVESIRGNKWSKHTLDMKYYGIAASTPAHAANDKIAWASQAEKVAWANVLKGQMITVNGKQMDAWDARELYFKIKTANIIEDFDELRSFFRDPAALERVFRQEIAEQGYNSDEMLYVLSRLKDGSFALPLFSPNVEHAVSQLMSSIIKKRLTKPRQKGANILQSTSLGMDVDVSAFSQHNALSESDKLRVKFVRTKDGRLRIKYVEVYLPLTDTRLKRFADENGNIGPDRLRELVEQKVIPEEALQFIAYRTPSDAEHSVIPCRVKGFMANAGGATIIMPKEVMNMTGHDYDGDKMRCHFPDFSLGWDEERIRKEYEEKSGDTIRIMRQIMELEDVEHELESLDSYRKWIKSEKNPNRESYRKVEYTQYDYNASPLENSRAARENARIQLMFSKLTSVDGSMRMLIPGGAEQTSIYAKTMYIIETAKEREDKIKVGKAIIAQENKKKLADPDAKVLTKGQVSDAINSGTLGMYNLLTNRSDSELTSIMKAITGTETPFSVTHAANSFETIMGGAEMIGIYALYNSAMQMFQRINLRYVPKKSDKGDVCKVSIFGNEFGADDKSLFEVKNHIGELSILGFARLLNAAVDNNKNPILGYLNQTKELAEMTFFLFANGCTEEEVHLIMNQPVIKELAERLKDRESRGFVSDANAILEELKKDDEYIGKLGQWKGVSIIGKTSKEEVIQMLGRGYDEVVDSANRYDLKEKQAALLHTLIHLHTAAGTLADFAKLTRPESESGSIGSSVQDLIAKVINLNDFRAELFKKGADQKLGIAGMQRVLAPREVIEGMNRDVLMDTIGDELSEVVALNSLMLDFGLELFRPYFPQVKDTWVSLAREIIGGYDKLSQRQKSAIIGKIGSEMILFKLLQDKGFVEGDPKEEQERILGYSKDGGVPYKLKELKERIARAAKEKDTYSEDRVVRKEDGTLGYYDDKGRFHKIDEAAEELIGNIFLEKLTFSSPEHGNVPRIRFDLGGPAIENQADTIRSYWAMMVSSEDEEVRQLAFDLFKYNFYANGFEYGMYEYAHFAPFSLLMQMPGYVDALNRILRSANWKNAEEKENFINQYYMVHWGDEKFVPQIIDWEDIHRVKQPDGRIGIKNDTAPAKLAIFEHNRYIVDKIRNTFVDKNGRTRYEDEYTLYRVDEGDSEFPYYLVKATKLSKVERNKQITMHYNPSVNYDLITPPFTPTESPWAETRVVRDAYAESNIDAPDDRREKQAPVPAGVDDAAQRKEAMDFVNNYIAQKSGRLQKLNDKVDEVAETANKKLDAAVSQTEDYKPVSAADELTPANDVLVVNDFTMTGSVGGFTPSDAFMQSLQEKAAKGELNIVRYDENGNLVTENVPATMENISLARKQKVFAALNKRLKDILRAKGVAVGTLYDSEARLALGGIADFDTATVLANGLREMIRVANGYVGEQALPEEFAHVALEMLGHDHPLVRRLLDALAKDDNAMQEAFGGFYDEYAKAYNNDKEKLILEAAGKLVAKSLFMQQEIETKPVRNLVQRIVDAIKEFFRKFRREEIDEAIFDANGIASKIAREMLGGKLLDDMSIEKIEASGTMLKKVAQDLSDKEDVLSKLLKREVKRLDVFKKRLQYLQKQTDSRALDDTQEEILKLQRAIRNGKTEEAVLSYIKDAMTFLASTNDSLVERIKSGANVNSICRKLNTVRDTLYSFSQSIEDVRQALASGEIEDTIGIQDSLNELDGKLGQYFATYNHIAMRYFEEMLSGMYGDRGLEVTIGKDRGRVISIHEMATRGDHDISFVSRWFNSIADCDDPVLAAIDDIVRNAKMKARAQAAEIQRELDVAFTKLYKETGSKDQSFMFERDANGNRTGKYISKKDAESLPEAQRDYYNVIMEIKDRIDDLLPESLIEDRKIIMLPKDKVERFKDADGIKAKAMTEWESIKDSVMDMSDDLDYEYETVVKDFEGNKVDMLPVKYMMKSEKQTYDDMTEDVATSLMSYAGMAFEYSELNNVIGVLENARYMASQREIAQHTGWRKQREAVGSPREDTAYYRERFTIKQAHTNIQAAMNDFYQMHIYGHLQKDEGTIGNTHVSVRGAVNVANRVASLSQMAVNLSQRIANVSTGSVQIIVESAGKTAYNGKDLLRASAIYARESGDRLAETGKLSPDNKLSLFDEMFDIHQNNGRKVKNFQRGRLSRIFGTNLLYAGLTIGEDYLANITALASALNYKMLNAEGKESNLWEAFKVKYTDEVSKTGAYLAIKDGWRKADGTEFTAEDGRAFAKSVIGLNFDLQGIYNDDDRSAVQQHAFGALLIMYRKWIAPAMKRRYGRTKYSKLKGSYEEGYYRTLFNLIRTSLSDAKDQVTEDESAKCMLNIIADIQAMINAVLVNWGKMTEYEKSNIHKAFTELGIVIGLWASTALMGKVPPQEDDDRSGFYKWWDNTVFSQLLRLRTEIGSQAPTPMMVSEATKILKSPFAAFRPIQDALNIFKLLVPSNYWTEMKSGRYKGHTRAYKYFHELPGISMWKRIDNFIDPSPLINYYKNDTI